MKRGWAGSGLRRRVLTAAVLWIFIVLMFPGSVSASTSVEIKKPADAELNKEYSFNAVLDANGGMFSAYESAVYDGHFSWIWTSDTTYNAHCDSADPDKDGYVLVGWSRNKGASVPEWDRYFGGMAVQVSNEKNYPEKLYAVWAKVYPITLHANGGGAFGYETIGGKKEYLDTKKVDFYYDPLDKSVKWTDAMKPWPWSIDEDKVLAAWDREYGPELEGLVLNDSAPKEFFANWENKDLADVRVYDLNDKPYTGKPVTQELEVCTSQYSIKLKEGTDYTVSYQNNVEVGTATVIIRGIGRYTGSAAKTFKIYESTEPKTDDPKTDDPKTTDTKKADTKKDDAKNTDVKKTDTKEADPKTVKTKKANPMKVKAVKVTLKYSALKKKAQKIAAKKAFKISKAKGKVTYKKAGGNAKIKISKAGKITVKKGLKKKTYKLKVKVTAAGNKSYKKLTKKVTVKIKVK